MYKELKTMTRSFLYMPASTKSVPKKALSNWKRGECAVRERPFQWTDHNCNVSLFVSNVKHFKENSFVCNSSANLAANYVCNVAIILKMWFKKIMKS